MVLAHGLTATRRYVVMGSTALQRSGHRVIAYDARGHGASSPAPDPAEYGYARARRATSRRCSTASGIERAVLAGASMGAHTLLWLALARPERVAGLVVITPAYDPESNDDPQRLARWDALSDGLRSGGIEGFLQAQGEPQVPERWRETVVKVIRQRLALHEHLDAVADALRAVPRSRPFARARGAGGDRGPDDVVASDDEADPEHPLAVGRGVCRRRFPGARLVTDEPGRSPIAWQGSQLSRLIAEVAEQAEL